MNHWFIQLHFLIPTTIYTHFPPPPNERINVYKNEHFLAVVMEYME